MIEIRDNFIDGGWRRSAGGRCSNIVDPSTEERLGTVVIAEEREVDEAVGAAGRAFPGWSAVPPNERAAILEAALARIEARTEAFVAGMAAEVGVPVWFGRLLQVPMPLKNGAVALETARAMEWTERLGPSLVRRVPVGVVAAITPWNAPLHQIVAKVVPALVAGCTLVLKPSEIVPSTARLFTEALREAGLPDGVLNLVWGDAGVGGLLVRHPGVDMVSFTGSEAGGAHVAEAAGRQIKRVVLELGGKSAAILLDDAPFETAVATVLTQCFANSGQTCVAQSRLLVPRARLAEVEELCREGARAWAPGDPRNEATRLGPVANAAQRERILAFLRRGAGEARVVAGGPEAARPERGFFVAPTVVSNVAPASELAQEEIFGPVLSVIAYDGEEEAVAISNGTRYGLSGSVWSADVSRATALASRLRTGQVGLNGAPQNFLAPFGGFKRSGFGRENGRFGVEEFLQHQAIHGAA